MIISSFWCPDYIAFLLFKNYEQPTLQVENPNFLNMYFICLFTLLILITLRRSVNEQPFSILQTDQMKGLAIIIIIVHHLFFFNIKQYPQVAFWQGLGSIGVSVFLILSGFGLSVSVQKKGIENFFSKRLVRIYIPLVFAMILEVVLNHFLLQSNKNILIDFVYIFVSPDSIDRNMWFVIFILFWYCLTYLAFRLKLSNKEKIILLCSASLLFLSMPQIYTRWKVNAFSFPLGFLLGLNSKFVIGKSQLLLKQNIFILSGVMLINFLFSQLLSKFVGKFYGYHHSLVGIALIFGFIATTYLIYVSNKKIKVDKPIETISLLLTIIILSLNYLGWDKSIAASGGMSWLIFTNLAGIFFATAIILLISLMVKFKVYSIFLSFIGKISFELYLLHGMFMYSFDFILFRGNIAVTFLIYFIAICLASLILKQISSIVSDSLLKRLKS